MPNLKDRLKIIHNLKKENKSVINNVIGINLPGWEECGYKVLKREVTRQSSINIGDKLPQAIEILIPDLTRLKANGKPLPAIKDFLFFDLETTGLGGAGTVAFLAAFGRFISGNKLLVTQYLLLDYPGENDFLNAELSEITKENAVVVSYNGKCFDSQVLKTRCLMNAVKPPFYFHADLLHPARRLWRNIIFDCSQASVETKILGLDRTGDIPGSEAPDIWFEFLKTGKTDRLIGICDHNVKDIFGLSAILEAIITIANDPLDQKKYQFDIQRLAFFWRFFLCRGKRYLLPEYKEILDTCNKLLTNIMNSDYSNEIKEEAGRYLKIYYKRWKKITANHTNNIEPYEQ